MIPEKLQVGKYKFNTLATLTVTTSFNNVGMPLKSKLYSFKSGDVIDVQKMFFKEGIGWEAQVSAITEQNRTVPFSVLVKVADTTPITTVDAKEQILSGSREGMVGGNTFPPNDNKSTSTTEPKKTFFTPKNIVIGVVVLGAVFGILKWQKVI
jgi:hypothetical protein